MITFEEAINWRSRFSAIGWAPSSDEDYKLAGALNPALHAQGMEEIGSDEPFIFRATTGLEPGQIAEVCLNSWATSMPQTIAGQPRPGLHDFDSKRASCPHPIDAVVCGTNRRLLIASTQSIHAFGYSDVTVFIPPYVKPYAAGLDPIIDWGVILSLNVLEDTVDQIERYLALDIVIVLKKGRRGMKFGSTAARNFEQILEDFARRICRIT